METFKGTKGKWTTYLNHDMNLTINSGKNIIGQVSNDYVTKEEFLNNAKLIASAPDLLEALQKVKELHKKHYKFHSLGQGFIEEADEIIEKAISKALD